MPSMDCLNPLPADRGDGGVTTVARYGPHHMRAIGKAGARATIARHGVSYFNGLMTCRGWHGRRLVASLAIDLAAGRVDALLAA